MAFFFFGNSLARNLPYSADPRTITLQSLNTSFWNWKKCYSARIFLKCYSARIAIVHESKNHVNHNMFTTVSGYKWRTKYNGSHNYILHMRKITHKKQNIFNSFSLMRKWSFFPWFWSITLQFRYIRNT